MSINFPTSLDNLTNPTGSDSLTSPSHAGQHSNANDAIEALEAKMGINSSAVTTSLDYKVNHIDHTAIANIGTNSHAQIDTAVTASTNHIAAANPHSGAAASGANTDITSLSLSAAGLKMKDAGGTKKLTVANSSTYTADRNLYLYTGDADRTITLNGDATLSGTNTGDQDLSGLVPKTTTVNSKALSANVTLTTADVADSADKRYCTDAQKTVIGNTSGTNSGNETTTTIGNLIAGSTNKATPADSDAFGLADGAASWILKFATWANIKAALKTYFDSLYVAISGALGTPSSGTLTNCTGLPVAGITASTSTALGVGSIELGHATDTTIARSGAGAITVEGVQVLLSGAALGTPASGTLTNCGSLPVSGITASTSTALGVGSIELGHATDTTIARSSAGVATIEGVVIDTVSGTNTLTNKRITKRTGSTTSSATPTINTDNVDMYLLTAQAADITSFTTNLSGTPTEGQTLWIAITGTAARAITWGTSFEASTVALPTTTVTTNRLDVGFVWNTVSSKWRCIASA